MTASVIPATGDLKATTLSATPRSTPARKPPQMLVRPPTRAAAKARRVSRVMKKTLTATRGAMSTPERADSAPAMAHVAMEVALVLIPDRAAA